MLPFLNVCACMVEGKTMIRTKRFFAIGTRKSSNRRDFLITKITWYHSFIRYDLLQYRINVFQERFGGDTFLFHMLPYEHGTGNTPIVHSCLHNSNGTYAYRSNIDRCPLPGYRNTTLFARDLFSCSLRDKHATQYRHQIFA